MTFPQIGILSLGCPRNLYDSRKLAAILKRKGFSVTEDISGPVHTVILNTCAFIEEAREETLGYIEALLDLKKRKVIRKIVVMGCLARRYKQEILKYYPRIDALYDIFDPFGVTVEPLFQDKSPYAYLKISEGCSNNCSYCTIPSIRGKLRSRTPEEIIKEARFFDRKGVKELVLVAQDTTSWGLDLYRRRSLPLLLTKILNSTGIPWIRILYAHPLHLDASLLKLMNKEKRICRYIDLPLQHVNNGILRGMGRKMSEKNIVDLLARVRGTVEGISVRTSFIVGFPGETDKEFAQLLRFVHRYPFEKMGCFMFSREEETGAYDLKGQVHHKTKTKRYNMLMSAQREISRSMLSGFVGKKMKVLVERKEGEFYVARTPHDAPEIDGEVFIEISGKKISVGDIIEVKITGSLDYDLEAKTI